jgi:sulfatase maturation enzyme AslB (radical SAM superfamily)
VVRLSVLDTEEGSWLFRSSARTSPPQPFRLGVQLHDLLKSSPAPIRSRVLPGDFHPIIAHLFTEWKCNLDCHYWAFDNHVKEMTEDVARRSIDWLHSTTCRVLALMGGEPLLRPQFAHKVVYYAAKKGFWVYLRANARLMRPEVTDRLADAGVRAASPNEKSFTRNAFTMFSRPAH